jgi:hypothetical protein
VPSELTEAREKL